MNTLHVGHDLDGVFFNFGSSVHRYLKRTGQGHLWKSGPNKKPYWNFYEDWGWTVQQFVDFCHAGADAGVIFNGPAQPGAVQVWRSLYRAPGVKIHVKTDRSFGSTPAVSEKITTGWLGTKRLGYETITFTPDKTSGPKCDLFIEDKPSNHKALTEAGVDAYLIDRPWNHDYETDKRIHTIGEWGAIVREKARSLKV